MNYFKRIICLFMGHDFFTANYNNFVKNGKKGVSFIQYCSRCDKIRTEDVFDEVNEYRVEYLDRLEDGLPMHYIVVLKAKNEADIYYSFNKKVREKGIMCNADGSHIISIESLSNNKWTTIVRYSAYH